MFILFILYTSGMFGLVENGLFAYADDSTLQAAVRKPADRPAVAASLNWDLARIQGWCNYWCMILNPNQTKGLVVSRSRTVNTPHGDLVISGDSIRASHNLVDILDVKFDNKLTFEDHVCGLFALSLRELVFCSWWNKYLCYLALRCHCVFVLQILEYCSPVWVSAAECHFQLLERQV